MRLPAVFVASILAAIPAGGTSLQDPPLPVIEAQDCIPDAKLDTGRWTMRIRNVHDVPLVARGLEFTDPERPNHRAISGADAVMDSRLHVQQGATAEERRLNPCTWGLKVAFGVFADGTAVGDHALILEQHRRWEAHLQAIEVILSVLRTTTVAQNGVNGRGELESVLESIGGPKAARAALGAVSGAESRPDIFNALKNEHLSKAALIEALEAGVFKLNRVLVRREAP